MGAILPDRSSDVCSRCPHSPLSWECCLQMAPSHQPCLGVASGEERHLLGPRPLPGAPHTKQ